MSLHWTYELTSRITGVAVNHWCIEQQTIKLRSRERADLQITDHVSVFCGDHWGDKLDFHHGCC